MTTVLYVLAALWVLDGLRMNRRLAALATLDPGAGHQGIDIVVHADDVTVPDDVAAAASAHARRNGLEVVDLVPPSLSTYDALVLAQHVDPGTYRSERLARGRSAAHATLVGADVAARAGLLPGVAGSESDLRDLGVRLKRYAPASTDLVVAPGLAARKGTIRGVARSLRALRGANQGLVLGAQLVLLVLMLLGLALPGSRTAAAVAIGCFHLQPLLMVLGTRLRPADLPLVVLLRLPWDLALWAAIVASGGKGRRAQLSAERRERYAAFADGSAPSAAFEPRRDDCPICGGNILAVALQTTDLLQHKPGNFTLVECGSCRTIFQNPRLSIAGLDLYYGDFYDGLGEDAAELIFASSGKAYQRRMRMVPLEVASGRWLDVGTGHGHFPNVCRDRFPDTRFEGLDLSESIEQAEREGWVERGYRGLFPELAPDLAGTYDVVSMSHYLEHTTDPRAELDAAAVALRDGGHLLVEVPDPESKLRKVLGRWWVPWFQPQHLHLIPPDTLGQLLRDAGLEPVAWEYGETHQSVDFLIAAVFLLEALGPVPYQPWRPPSTPLAPLRRAVVWTLGVPLLLVAVVADRALAPLLSRRGWSNGYRVLAAKTPPG